MTIRRILGIYCWLTKHRRGVELHCPTDTTYLGEPFRTFACPRCGRTTRYKVKPALGTAAKGDSQ